MIVQMLFLAFPMKTLFVPVEVAKFCPVTVRTYPPPLFPELIDRLLTIIL